MSRLASEFFSVRVDADVLMDLMPMHLVVDAKGSIRSRGRTMAKIIGDADRLSDAFDIQAVSDGDFKPDMTGAKLICQQKFIARLMNAPAITLRGSGRGIKENVSILNFGFGVCLAEAVRKFELTSADFLPSDLAMEFLFLHEANRATISLLDSVNTSLEQATADAHLRSLTDPLTGLLNRRAFDLEFAAAYRNRKSKPFALAHLDLDNFKGVNDRFGHHSGDLVLQEVAKAISSQIRACDLAFRSGGDEFLMLIFQPRSNDDMISLCLRLIDRIKLVGTDYCSPSLSASVGIAMLNIGDAGRRQIFDLADEALYAAKAAGKANVIIL